MSNSTPLTCERETWRVCVIDDDVESLRLIELLFRRDNIPVALFDNVPEGLRAITDGDYNLLLLDLLIPGDYDGFELHKQLREERFPIMIVAFTSLVKPLDLARARSIGFDGYLTKPFNPQTIFPLLRAFISAFIIWRGGLPCHTRL